MIKFSDIFGDDKQKKKETPPEQKESSASSIDFSAIKDKEPPQKESFKDLIPKPAETEALYNKGVLLADKIFNSDDALNKAVTKDIKQFITDLITYVAGKNHWLLGCVFGSSYPQEVNSAVLNLVNVCILSLELGVGLHYNQSRLLNLGLAAFLHDLGTRPYRDMISQPKNFNDQEKEVMRNLVNKNPIVATEMEQLQNDLSSVIFEIIKQEREIIGSSGSIPGVRDEEIAEYAQIVGLTDVYEALTHERPYRDKNYTPVEALKIILDNKKLFNSRVIKVFLERVGMYPQGTFVELNTREVAQVVRQNHRMPLCPIVRVAYDPEGNKVDKEREIDLSEGTKIYIVKSI
jgi:HD-GYP domain-containing protein (c-di-GMP phosphodiesterase class II)